MATATLLPPDLVALAGAHRLRQQQLAYAATTRLGRLWGFLDAAGLAASWAALAPRFVAVMTAAQAEAARGADDYVAAALMAAGEVPDPAGVVPARTFAGAASDGRTLDGLLGYPVFEVQAFLDGGMAAAAALEIGRRHLVRIVATQVADAARVATGVAVVNDRRTTGYVRMLTPPSCSRCVVLAGKWYRYNRGFQRHPHCDCVHMPSAEVIHPPSPKKIFESMSPAELKNAGWSAADVQAINDGADIYQVTNARQGLRTVAVAGQQLQTTTSGATRRGLAGQRLGARRGNQLVRLTPESIYAEAERLGWSRDETIRQLTRHGYIL